MVENILGSDWIIEFKSSKEDDFDDCDGYTSTKNGERRICIKKDSYQSIETVIRHELIHAFLFDEGLKTAHRQT